MKKQPEQQSPQSQQQPILNLNDPNTSLSNIVITSDSRGIRYGNVNLTHQQQQQPQQRQLSNLVITQSSTNITNEDLTLANNLGLPNEQTQPQFSDNYTGDQVIIIYI